MAVALLSTKGARNQGTKILIYGGSKVGKTSALAKLHEDKPGDLLILSTEKGLMSLQDYEIPYIDISSMKDFEEAYTYVTTDPVGKQFGRIALDSITDIAEVCLSAEKKKSSDGRQSYGNLAEIMGDFIRKFRDLPGRDIFFIAQMEKVQDESGKLLYGPAMPGKTLTQQLPYWFDIILRLHSVKTVNEETKKEEIVRAFQCVDDSSSIAGNRGGKLEFWENADLGSVINKIKEAK